jgi:hypothetical protein
VHHGGGGIERTEKYGKREELRMLGTARTVRKVL